MKPRLLILVFVVACLVISGLVGFWGHSAPQPIPSARFLGLTNGVPGNTSLTRIGPVAVFARGSAREAGLVRAWLNAVTNTAMFTVSNSLDHPICRLQQARMETSRDAGRWGQHTPLLEGEVHLPPRQAATVQVALVAHEGIWRIQFCYLLVPEGSLLSTVMAKLKGTATHGSTSFSYSDWVKL